MKKYGSSEKLVVESSEAPPSIPKDEEEKPKDASNSSRE